MEITSLAFFYMISIINTNVFSNLNEINNIELYCLAANSYFESGGETFDGKIAVAQVVLNRVKSKHFPNSICKVIQEGPIRESWKTKKIKNFPKKKRIYYTIKNRCQFSWYCDGLSESIPIQRKNGTINKIVESMWRDSIFAAILVYTKRAKNLIGSSTHYYAFKKVTPNWHQLTEFKVIENHRFMYNKNKLISR